MSRVTNLKNAQKTKNDEFYTLYEDIEKELSHYAEFFKDKVIYCNCDSETSNFYKYFVNNFTKLGLKKLRASHYNKDGSSYYLCYNGTSELRKDLQGDGDFRSDECIRLLEETDIVVTNPPFSLFRDFTKTILNHNKDFLIVGNINAVSYKEFFPYIKDNKVTTGYNSLSKFMQPDDTIKQVAAYWYTTLPVEEKPMLNLTAHYSPEKYPKYDNYDAINCNKVKDIPMDYYVTKIVTEEELQALRDAGEWFEILEVIDDEEI